MKKSFIKKEEKEKFFTGKEKEETKETKETKTGKVEVIFDVDTGRGGFFPGA